jgi:hypothetical protein
MSKTRNKSSKKSQNNSWHTFDMTISSVTGGSKKKKKGANSVVAVSADTTHDTA